ncbi:MAG: hypothetical protein V7K72_16175 [Nostoc sp.]|uniref:hypothetical protein n=1 Tax=Nostoc sp. TaxID=1180 RepID=UPI002FF68338
MELKDSLMEFKGALRFRATTSYDYDRFIIAISTTRVAPALPTLQAIALWHTLNIVSSRQFHEYSSRTSKSD